MWRLFSSIRVAAIFTAYQLYPWNTCPGIQEGSLVVRARLHIWYHYHYSTTSTSTTTTATTTPTTVLVLLALVLLVRLVL